MANRFTNITQAQFDPLSMQEIMAVPMAMQAKHDAALAQDDATQLLSAKVGSNDQGAIDKELGELKSRSAALSQDIRDNGYNRASKGKFSKLKRDTQQAFSAEGNIGYAMGQSQAKQAYLKDFDDNGWGNTARNYANKQVSEHSSFNEDGSRNAFQGGQVDKFIDAVPVLRTAVKDVLPQLSQAGRDLLLTQGAKGLAEAAAIKGNGLLGKDYTTVMAHLKNVTEGSPELMASLRQQGLFNGDDNWNDFGQMKWTSVPQDNGKVLLVADWEEGYSPQGLLMNSFGALSSTPDNSIAGLFNQAESNLERSEEEAAALKAQGNYSVGTGASDMYNENYSVAATNASIDNHNQIIAQSRGTLEQIIKSSQKAGASAEENELAADEARKQQPYLDAVEALDNSSHKVDSLKATKDAYWRRAQDRFSSNLLDRYNMEHEVSSGDPKKIFNEMIASGEVDEDGMLVAERFAALEKAYPDWSERTLRKARAWESQDDYLNRGIEHYQEQGFNKGDALNKSLHDYQYQELVNDVDRATFGRNTDTGFFGGNQVSFENNNPEFMDDYYKAKIYATKGADANAGVISSFRGGSLHAPGGDNFYKAFYKRVNEDIDKEISGHMNAVGNTDAIHESYNYDILTGGEGSLIEKQTKLINASKINPSDYEVVNQGDTSGTFVTDKILAQLGGEPILPVEGKEPSADVNRGYKISFAITGANGYDEEGNRVIQMNIQGLSGTSRSVIVKASADQVRLMDQIVPELTSDRQRQYAANSRWMGAITKTKIWEDKEEGYITIPGLELTEEDSKGKTEQERQAASKLKYIRTIHGDKTYWSLEDSNGHRLSVRGQKMFSSKKEMALGIDNYVFNEEYNKD